MWKRKYLFLCLILLLLSVTAVSASDTDNITLQASTDMSDGGIASDVGEISSQEGNDTLDDAIAVNQEDSQDILAVSDDKNTGLGLAFKDLQKLVDEAPEGSEISLNDNYYVASGGHTIKISKSITINGNNHILDANKDGRIAIIEADGKSVVFKNIKFVNGSGSNVTIADGAGAIYCKGNCNIFNCSFNNNYANEGGAIYCEGDCNIESSSFNENFGYYAGGAIYCKGNCNIKSSSFNKNKLDNDGTIGGAIYCKGNCNIESSSFNENLGSHSGGAIFCEGNCNIKSSSFNKNRINEDGGAIYCKGNCNIESSSFNENMAEGKTVGIRSFGGAIRSKGLITVTDSRFENNEAYNWGGAIYADKEIRITDSTFTGNSAREAGAVYASTIGQTVSKSVFLNNSATEGDGGAINIWNECTPEFISCRFEGNTADKRGGAIYVDSSKSQLRVSYCTFIDNHADKNGYSSLLYDCFAGHSIFNCGHYNLWDMCWLGTNNPDFNEQFTKHYTEKNDNHYVPDNRYLRIDIKINDTYLYVRNKYEVTVNFHDGNGKVLEKDLLHSTGRISGDAIFANLNVDCNDMTAYANLTKENCVIVGELDHQNVTLNLNAKNKTQSNITIVKLTILDDSIYVMCTVDPTPGHPPKYVIMNSEGDIIRQGNMSIYNLIDIYDNKYDLRVRDLPPGSYTVTVINPENFLDLASNETKSFNIILNASANITADNVVYGNNTTITLKADYDGLYNVSINDLIIEMEVTNGSCVKQIKLNAGKYKTHTKCTKDYVELSCNETSFNVYKATPLFNLNVSSNEFTYGDEVSVSHILPSDATGNISYSLNKEQYANLSVNDSLKLSDAGSYLIDATYTGDTNYYPAKDSTTIKINPAKNKATVSVDDVTYGENTIIKVSADTNGVYAVDVNGTVYNITVNNGIGNKTIALNAGTYYANATFNNRNYNTTYRNTAFSVYKADVKLNITVLDEVYPQDVEGVVHATRDGKYNLTIGDYKDIIVVKDGICYFNIGTLDAGSYEAVVSLKDDNYNPASNSTNFVVNASGTLFEIEVTSSEITYGETVTVTHTINDGATGNITYFLSDGTLLGVMPVGKNLTLPVLPAGPYVIAADYSGDGDFIPASDIAFFTVNKAPNNVIVKVDDVTYGENAIIEVSAVADGIYTVDVNGTTYTITVKNGIGNKSISLIAGTYYANATFNNKNYITKIKNTVFNVNKADTNIVVAVSDTSYLQDVVGTIYAGADGEYGVTVGDYSTTLIVKNGSGEFNAGILDAGNYTVTATYPGDLNHKANSSSANINIAKFTPNITLNVSDINWGEVEVITVTSDIYGSVNVTVNDRTVTLDLDGTTRYLLAASLNAVSDSEYNASLELDNLNLGSYPVTVVYNGDDNIESIKLSGEFKVNGLNAAMNVDVSDIFVGDDEIITATLPDDATGTVTTTVDGKNYTAPVRNGTATITIPELSVGSYTIPVTYSGDDKYNPETKNINFTVKDTSDIITAPDVTKYFSGPERFTVNVTDYQGNPLANKTVIININNKNYTRTTDENGTASIALNLPSRTYNTTVTVDNQTINSTVTVLSTVNGTDVIKMYKNATQYYATFLDSKGNYLAKGTTVNFNINGVFYERKVSGDKGLAKLNINLPAGEYIITAINPETGENTANNITVISNLAENKDITKYYKNATQYTVKVIGADGKAVGAGENVTFNINGIFYTRQTNESGIAKLNINLPQGNYTVTATYNDCKVSNTIKVLSVLQTKDLSMKYKDGSKFEAKILNSQGKPYAGQTVTFNINGVFYKKVTGDDGIAKLNINLIAGEYIITSTYNGLNVANKVTIYS